MRTRSPLIGAAVCLSVLLGACGSNEPAQSVTPSDTGTPLSVSPSDHTPDASPEHSPTESEPSPSAPPVEASGPEVRAFLALCGVEAALQEGAIPAAEAAFEDDVHETLHEIAHEVEEVDREVAAALLVAKSKVEAGFADDGTKPAALARDVAGLLVATADAMAVIDIQAPGCPA